MNNLEPQSLVEYPGQERAKACLMPSLMAARTGKPLPHILLHGPAGVGKTVLANLISKELGSLCKVVDARDLRTKTQFLNLVENMRDNDVLFIDEVHGLNKELEELLYLIVDKFGFWHCVGTQQCWIPLHHFVMVGATTKMGEISSPLLTRFGLVLALDWYDEATLAEMAVTIAAKMGLLITEEAAAMLGRTSRGVARTLVNLLNRADDIARCTATKLIDEGIMANVLAIMGVDHHGLNDQDRKYLTILGRQFGNQPTGLATLAAVLGTNEDTVADAIEPYLLRQGYVLRTSRGRIVTQHGLGVTNA